MTAADAVLARTRQAVSAETLALITQFLGHETFLLDNDRIEDWIALLDPAIIYEIPLRIAAQCRADEMPAGAHRVRDDLMMIRKRLERLGTQQNWAEDPPSRTVRTVGSIWVEGEEEPGLWRVHSALTLYRQRATDRAFDWLAVRRNDLIRVDGGGCWLVRRSVILAESVLQMPNLSVFL